MKNGYFKNNTIKKIFKDIYNKWFTNNDIKELYISALSPFFKDKSYIIKNELYNILATETLWLIRLKKHKKEYNLIHWLLNQFNSDSKKNNLINNYLKFLELREWVIINYYTILNTQKSIDELNDMPLYDSFKLIFDLIWDSIEWILKPYFFILYLLEDWNENTILNDIKKIDLWRIIDKLENNTLLKPFLYKLNYNNESIKLSQLRNIWGHKKYEVLETEKIIKCIYWKSNPTTIIFKLEDLIKIWKELSSFYQSLHLSILFFYFLNNKKLSSKYNNIKLNDIRIDSKFDTLTSKLWSQWFEIIKYNISKEESFLELKDISNLKNIQKRAIHSSQFLYHLYLLNKSKILKINFIPNNKDKISFSFNVKWSICKKIYDWEKSINYLAKKFDFEKFDSNV